MSLYKKIEWKEFRQNVIESDDFKCTSCNRTAKEVVLQVHHKFYIKGKLPWEYGTENCITLCKGCHASEHGIIKPKIGWDYVVIGRYKETEEMDFNDLKRSFKTAINQIHTSRKSK